MKLAPDIKKKGTDDEVVVVAYEITSGKGNVFTMSFFLFSLFFSRPCLASSNGSAGYIRMRRADASSGSKCIHTKPALLASPTAQQQHNRRHPPHAQTHKTTTTTGSVCYTTAIWRHNLPAFKGPMSAGISRLVFPFIRLSFSLSILLARRWNK